MEKLRVLYARYRSYVNYVLAGVLTTVISFLVYFGLRLGFDANPAIANGLAWVCAVLVAFITNKKYVFETKTTSWGSFFREMAAFFGARGVSGAFETASMWLFVDVLGMNSELQEFIVKVIVSGVVLVLNYIFSKVFVFRKKS